MKFEKQTFTTDVTLDCNEFIDCVIKNCVIHHEGGAFSMLRTRLENVRFGVGGPAQNVLGFLRLVAATNPAAIGELLGAQQDPGPERSTTAS